MSALTIDQSWLDANRRKEPSWVKEGLDYTNQPNGVLRTLQLVNGTSKVVQELGSTSSIAAKLADGSGAAMPGLGMAHLPGATSDALQAIGNLSHNDGVPIERKVGVAVKDTMGAATSWGYFISFLTANPVVKAIAQITDITGDVSDLGLSVSNYRQAAELEPCAEGEVKTVVIRTKTYYMLCIAKAILSIASTLFAILLCFTGMKLLPTTMTILLALSATFMAVRRDLFKGQGAYPVLTFDYPVKV